MLLEKFYTRIIPQEGLENFIKKNRESDFTTDNITIVTQQLIEMLFFTDLKAKEGYIATNTLDVSDQRMMINVVTCLSNIILSIKANSDIILKNIMDYVEKGKELDSSSIFSIIMMSIMYDEEGNNIGEIANEKGYDDTELDS